jgi:hypothetical protein
MELIQCGFCNSKVNLEKIVNHILKVHFLENFEKVDSYLLSNQIINNITSDSWIKNIEFRKDFKRKEKSTSKLNLENTTIYVKWNDLIFERNYMLISTSVAYIKKFKILGVNSTLNQIKPSVISKYNESGIFKLSITPSREISVKSKSTSQSGIKNLLRIINRFVLDNKVQEFKVVDKSMSPQILKKNKSQKLNKNSIKDFIKSIKIKNEYISYSSDILNDKDFAYCIIENNNNIDEDSILFIFERMNKFYVLWENINSKRAGYLFIYRKNFFESELEKLISFISKTIKNKRENLFSGTNLSDIGILCDSYYSLIHENINSYKSKLNKHIK